MLLTICLERAQSPYPCYEKKYYILFMSSPFQLFIQTVTVHFEAQSSKEKPMQTHLFSQVTYLLEQVEQISYGCKMLKYTHTHQLWHNEKHFAARYISLFASESLKQALPTNKKNMFKSLDVKMYKKNLSTQQSCSYLSYLVDGLLQCLLVQWICH